MLPFAEFGVIWGSSFGVELCLFAEIIPELGSSLSSVGHGTYSGR